MTKLLYLENWNLLTCESKIIKTTTYRDKPAIVLDQTVFYPQGGGQPWDTGAITGSHGLCAVNEVRFDPETGTVYHLGAITGELTAGDAVSCTVDEPRRLLNSRLHSGGHLLDMALARLGINWKPSKGYHFPEGPYVEYVGTLDGLDKEKLRGEIETVCAALIGEDMPTSMTFLPKGEVKGKPARVVLYGNHQIPCGGTHVNHLGQIGAVTVRKIKQEKDLVRIAYAIAG